MPTREPIRLVAVGASAGGVEALSELLPSLPPAFGLPVLVVLHLPRERPSMLVELFGPRCALPLCEVSDKQPIVPGTICFAPPDYHLLVEDGWLSLSQDEPVQFSRPSIDVLFESAAEAYGPAVAGVLLTGANADGAAGMRAISRAGGLTIIQDPLEAHSPEMPRAALNLVRVDHVVGLRQLGPLLAGLGTGAARVSHE